MRNYFILNKVRNDESLSTTICYKKNQINLNDRTIRRSPEILSGKKEINISDNNIVCSPGETRFFNIDINDEDYCP